MGPRYGRDRVIKGLMHFLLGKGISSVAGFLGIVLVIRALPVDQFASYSVLVALVETLTALSGLGLAHALLRYVPELYSQHYHLALRRYVGGSILLRSGVLLVVTLVAYLMSGQLAPLIGLGDEIGPFQLFLLLVFLRSTSQFLSQILESTLHQAIAQTAFSVSSVLRLLGMLYLHGMPNVALAQVIWVEVGSEAVGLSIMLFGVLRVIFRGAEGSAIPRDDETWLKTHIRQIAHFALAGYAQHLAILPYGGNTNRLVGGRLLQDAQMASFGFAQSLYEYVKRYLPAQLLVGLIRPVVVARYAEKHNFAEAAGISGKVLQINILCICAVLATLIVGGVDVITWMSAGKYGANVTIILFALLVVLLLETQRQQLELMVQTVEIYAVLIPSNIVLAASVVLAIILLPSFGALAFPMGNIVGLIGANAWVQRRMDALGYRFRHNWHSSIKILSILIASIAVSWGIKQLGVPAIPAAMMAGLIYTILGYIFCGDVVRDFISDLTGRVRQLPALIEPIPMAQPKIAFGILSSKQSAAAIEQIAAAVYPHPVIVHHDFSKQPDFAPRGENVAILSNPVATAWGDWSLVEATFRLMKKAIEDPAVTHFQLLSESCLPIRKISEFEHYLMDKQPDAMIDVLSMDDKQLLYSHGWRYFPSTRFLRRLSRRASVWAMGGAPEHRDLGSLDVRISVISQDFWRGARQRVGRAILHLIANSGRALLEKNCLRQYAVGAQWFGANRRTVQWLLDARQALSGFTEHYQRCHIPDESYIHTLLYNAQLSGLALRILPTNHALFWDGHGTGPDQMEMSDLPRLYNGDKYFARKFSLEPSTEVRQQILTSAAMKVNETPVSRTDF